MGPSAPISIDPSLHILLQQNTDQNSNCSEQGGTGMKLLREVCFVAEIALWGR
jgi:hypothetical protein